MDKESNLSTILAEATSKLHNVKNTEYHKCKQIWREVIESTNKIPGSGITNSIILKRETNPNKKKAKRQYTYNFKEDLSKWKTQPL